MIDPTEHTDTMRALIEGGLWGKDRAQFIARMRAHMISVAAYVLANQQTTFRDASVFLSEALASHVKSLGQADRVQSRAGSLSTPQLCEAQDRHEATEEKPGPSP